MLKSHLERLHSHIQPGQEQLSSNSVLVVQHLLLLGKQLPLVDVERSGENGFADKIWVCCWQNFS